MSATGRNVEGHERHADDDYATPAWCVRAVLPHLASSTVLDPCCGHGALLDIVADEWKVPTFGIELDAARAKLAKSRHAVARDDALKVEWPSALVITNPPYNLAEEFIRKALARKTAFDAAFLLRLNFLGSQKRAQFHRDNPSDVFVLPRRPSFTPDGKTDATEYAWFVWGPGRGGRWKMLDVEGRLRA